MTSKPIVEQWFPKPLYIVNDFMVNELPVYRKWLYELFSLNDDMKRTEELNVNSTHNMTTLHTLDIFRNLSNEITKNATQFVRMLGYSGDLFINNMWANHVVKGEYLFPHNHPNSMLSGAYYIESDHPEDVIKFYDNPMNMLPAPDEYTSLSYDYCAYRCQPGRLILFKSDFIHGCPALKGESKIVMSFNIGFVNSFNFEVAEPE
jgi:uncharacterized protein (TIGR02466 family)